MSISSTEFEVTMPPGAVGENETFVLSAAVVPIENGVPVSVDFDIARGAIAPCRVVEGP